MHTTQVLALIFVSDYITLHYITLQANTFHIHLLSQLYPGQNPEPILVTLDAGAELSHVKRYKCTVSFNTIDLQ